MKGVQRHMEKYHKDLLNAHAEKRNNVKKRNSTAMDLFFEQPRLKRRKLRQSQINNILRSSLHDGQSVV